MLNFKKLFSFLICRVRCARATSWWSRHLSSLICTLRACVGWSRLRPTVRPMSSRHQEQSICQFIWTQPGNKDKTTVSVWNPNVRISANIFEKCSIPKRFGFWTSTVLYIECLKSKLVCISDSSVSSRFQTVDFTVSEIQIKTFRFRTLLSVWNMNSKKSKWDKKIGFQTEKSV